MDTKEKITGGLTFLGIELGSTRIKATLTDDNYTPIANGSYEWENSITDGYWTYPEEKIKQGVKACYADLKRAIREKYGVVPERFSAIGISAMMHGYMAFDNDENLLVPFRTWRNTTASAAASELTRLFGFNIPARWSIAHLYQVIIDKEPHLSRVDHINTLAGYIHFLLTGKRVLGIGDASGMFPIKDGNYNGEMAAKFNDTALQHGFGTDIVSLLPEVLSAGENAGNLTEAGAAFLDPDGDLSAGIPFCPPEGDAGTGMTATNAVRPGTGNISAGTSIFSMLVLEKPLGGVYPEIDIVTTPDGSPVAMVHCNNCCSELDMWVRLFEEFARLSGNPTDRSSMYKMLYENSLNGDEDCGGIVSYGCLSGEPVIGVENGRPMYFRLPDGKTDLANFFRAQIYSSFAPLCLGMDILLKTENIRAERFTGHGGLFKVKGVAQQYLSDALGTNVSVMETAGEGGSFGMSLLACYLIKGKGKSLSEWLESEVFGNVSEYTVTPGEKGRKGFSDYMERYKAGLDAEKSLGKVK